MTSSQKRWQPHGSASITSNVVSSAFPSLRSFRAFRVSISHLWVEAEVSQKAAVREAELRTQVAQSEEEAAMVGVLEKKTGLGTNHKAISCETVGVKTYLAGGQSQLILHFLDAFRGSF